MLYQFKQRMGELLAQYKLIVRQKQQEFNLTKATLPFDIYAFLQTLSKYINEYYDEDKKFANNVQPNIDAQVVTAADEIQTRKLRPACEKVINYIRDNKAELKKFISDNHTDDEKDLANDALNDEAFYQAKLQSGGEVSNNEAALQKGKIATYERYHESPLIKDTTPDFDNTIDHSNNKLSAIDNVFNAATSGDKPTQNSNKLSAIDNVFDSETQENNTKKTEGSDNKGNSSNNENDDYNDPELNVGNKYAYKNFNELPLTDANGMNEDDVEQGSLGDCYALSSLSALARDTEAKELLRKNITKVKENLYEVTVYVKELDKQGNPLGRIAKKVRVDTDFPVDKEGKLAYAKAKNQELWVLILEKAYAKAMGGYDNIHAGKGSEALAAFTGKEATVSAMVTTKTNDILSLASNLKIAIFQTNEKSDTEFWELEDGQKIYQGHAYSFQSYDAASKKIKLRNPHGQEHLILSAEEIKAYFVSISSISLAAK